MLSQQNYSNLLDQYSKNVIASNTDLEGIITYVSEAFCDICGYTEEELVGSSHNIVRHPDMSKELFKEFWKTIKNDKTFAGEIKNKRKDGSSYWVEASVSPIFDTNGKKIGYSAIRHDITQKKEFEKLNTQHNKLLKEYSKYVIASKADLDGVITYVSDAFCEISGYTREELIGQNHNIIRHPDMPSSQFEDLWKVIRSGKIYLGEFKNKKKNGGYYWVEVAISPEYNENNEIIGYSGIRHNISEKKMIEELMIVDSLTRVKNRRYYDQTIDKEIDLVKRYNNSMSLILMDIDYFKKINDKYGHDIGDSVLVEFSRIIENSIRKCDTFCRIGGEEFILISPSTTYEQNYLFANKLREIVQNHDFTVVKDVTISIGLANCQQDDNKETLFKKADTALYKSKNNGRNQVTIES